MQSMPCCWLFWRSVARTIQPIVLEECLGSTLGCKPHMCSINLKDPGPAAKCWKPASNGATCLGAHMEQRFVRKHTAAAGGHKSRTLRGTRTAVPEQPEGVTTQLAKAFAQPLCMTRMRTYKKNSECGRNVELHRARPWEADSTCPATSARFCCRRAVKTWCTIGCRLASVSVPSPPPGIQKQNAVWTRVCCSLSTMEAGLELFPLALPLVLEMLKATSQTSQHHGFALESFTRPPLAT